MGLGLPTSSTKRNDPIIGNHHLRAPLGDLKVEGASVRTGTPVIVGTTPKQCAVAPDGSEDAIGWVERKATGDKATSRDADYAADTIVNVAGGIGVIRDVRVAAAAAPAAGDYLTSNGDSTLRVWLAGDGEGAKVARALEAKAAGAIGRIAALCLK